MIETLAIDPGGSVGVASFNEDGSNEYCYTARAQDLHDVLETYPNLKRIIVEDYVIYAGKEKQHRYNKLQTAKQIGEITNYCRFKKLKIEMVKASDKVTGYAYLGVKPLPKSNPRNHALDAKALGTFWLVKNGILDPRKLL